ncbi:MAG TPA: hypothetical protein VN442_22860 [Bryobacteraceae bacterium]|nr:hypothetical protein [Bryobacteraceae bacterium]
MFFRRRSPKLATFADRLENLRRAGFTIAALPDGAVQVSRDGCGATLREGNGVLRAGWLEGGEIAALVDGGFQKFLLAPSGKRRPALADDLRALHRFEEELKAVLGLTSLYNEGLGTVSAYYRYDRLAGRGT